MIQAISDKPITYGATASSYMTESGEEWGWYGGGISSNYRTPDECLNRRERRRLKKFRKGLKKSTTKKAKE